MTTPTGEQIREALIDEVSKQLASQGRAFDPDQVTDDSDLLLSGLIDSLGLLELAASLSDYCGFEIDFSELAPDDLTVVGPLCDFIVVQAADRRALA